MSDVKGNTRLAKGSTVGLDLARNLFLVSPSLSRVNVLTRIRKTVLTLPPFSAPAH